MLAVSGTLDRNLGGRATDLLDKNGNVRRTLYGYVDRQYLEPVFRVFDFPNPDMHSPQRFDTTVPQQALFLMNSPFLMDQARALAKRTVNPENSHADDRIRTYYRTVFQRPPTDDEIFKGLEFLASAQPLMLPSH